jgi:hypothetical protein
MLPMKIKVMFLLCLVACQCHAADQFKASKILEMATMNGLLKSVGDGLQMQRVGGGGSAGGGMFRASLDMDAILTCDDSTRRQFMSALRSASQNLLKEHGATIHGWGKRGSDDDLNGFSWEYTWNSNNGLILVRFYPTGSGKGTLTIFCYEHTRGTAAPPRAKGY